MVLKCSEEYLEPKVIYQIWGCSLFFIWVLFCIIRLFTMFLCFLLLMEELPWKSRYPSFFLCLATPWGLWCLSSLTRNWTQATAVKAPSLNHWTARESPRYPSLDLRNENSFIMNRHCILLRYDWVKLCMQFKLLSMTCANLAHLYSLLVALSWPLVILFFWLINMVGTDTLGRSPEFTP